VKVASRTTYREGSLVSTFPKHKRIRAGAVKIALTVVIFTVTLPVCAGGRVRRAQKISRDEVPPARNRRQWN